MRRSVVIAVPALFLCLFIAGCFSPWQGDMAAFSINLGGQSGRAVDYPPGSADVALLRFTANFAPVGGGTAQKFSSNGSEKISGTIAPGTYFVSIDISLLENGSLFAQGEAVNNPVTLIPGVSSAIGVNVRQLSYTVSFDLNGGTGPGPEPLIVSASNEVEMPGIAGVSNGGLVFGGWCTNPDGLGYAYMENEKLTPETDTVLYAKWAYGLVSGAVSINPSSSLTGNVYRYGEAITATALLDGGNTPQYQWKRNDEIISGATNSSYTPSEIDWNQEISVAVTSANASGTIEEIVGIIYKAIGSPAEMQAIGDSASNLEGHYLVTGKIEPSGAGTWIPIGSSAVPFSGVFDGNGKTINMGTSAYYANRNDLFTGLFGYIGPNGEVKNFRLEGTISVNNSSIPLTGIQLGAVAGRNDGTIKRVSSSAAVSASFSVNGGGSVGGIAGTNSGVIQSCFNSQNVSSNIADPSSAVFVGGIAAMNTGTVIFCWATGEVLSNNSASDAFAGGIVCENMGNVESCVALGAKVSGSIVDKVGRIVVNNPAPSPMSSLTKNYAKADMMLIADATTSDISDGLKNGANVSLGSITQSWWTTDPNGPQWSFAFGGSGTTRESMPWEWNTDINRPKLWFE